jgi:hypothetical protein
MTQPKNSFEEQRQQRILAYKEASKPVIEELNQAGFNVEWIDDLYNKPIDYRNAIPILIRWLPRIENPMVKEVIVRALSVKWARNTDAAKLLVDEYRKAKNIYNLNWAIGNALSVVADDEVLNDIIELIQDKTYGKAREMLAVALGGMKTPTVKPLLIDLLEDEEIAGHVIMSIRKLRVKEAIPALERFKNHPKSWVRREAKKALAKIDI